MSKKKGKKEKSFASTIVVSFMFIFAVVVAVSIYTQNKLLNELKQEEASIVQEIDKQKNEKLTLEGKQDYYKSDEYIEKVAREQFGLVKSDEIVFVNKSE